MRRNSLFLCMILSSIVLNAQLTIQSGAQLFIQPGATVTVQGDVTSNADILGGGILRMGGTAAQNLNFNGFTIPNLQIANTNNVFLTGAGRIGNSLDFVSGKIKTGNFNLELTDVATVTGAGAGKFVETNGTGELRKLLTGDVSGFSMPLGYSTYYTPVLISAAGSYAPAAYIGTHSDSGASANKPLRSTDFLNTSWRLTRSGITGTATGVASYGDATDVTGIEADLRGFVWDGTNWSLSGASLDASTNMITANILPSGVNVYAMNRFVYLNSKVFLQGAYLPGMLIGETPVMLDNLRTAPNLIPVNDPYRTAPYNSVFTHVANTHAEVANANVFIDQADARNNIVDWVFIELRNTATGNTVIQTRSALLQRDGDVVEIDGISPLYFKNIDANNFTVTVRHRNHLGISADPVAFTKALNEQTSSTLDFSTAADAQLFGNAQAYATSNSITMLWAGDINGNGISRYQGSNGPTGPNDRSALLTALGNTQSNVLNGYFRGDINMNRVTRFQGSNGPGTFGLNDRIFLLTIVLGSTESVIRLQQLPN